MTPRHGESRRESCPQPVTGESRERRPETQEHRNMVAANASLSGVTAGETADDDGDWALLLAVTVGATAAAFVLGGLGYGLWLLAQQPAVALERLAAVVTLAVGFGAMVLGMERGR